MRHLSLLMAALLLLMSCGGNSNKSNDCDYDFIDESSLTKINNSIINGDAAAFASMVDYPIRRKYPIKDIEDSATMVKFFPIIVDDSLKNMVRNLGLNGWKAMGWRGIMFNNGELWSDINIIAINHMSDAEQQLLDSLRAKEIASLHPSLRTENFIPSICFKDIDIDAIYRIDYFHPDSNKKYPYRLAVYKNTRHLSGKPDAVLNGYLDIEGSAAVHYFYFFDHDTNSHINFTIDYYEKPDTIYGDVELFGLKTNESHRLKPVYWLDYTASK